MVKGISRQVIVVPSPDPELFEQAIFILRDDAVAQGISDEVLMKQARRVIQGSGREGKKYKLYLYGPVWACAGAVVTGAAWLLTALL